MKLNPILHIIDSEEPIRFVLSKTLLLNRVTLSPISTAFLTPSDEPAPTTLLNLIPDRPMMLDRRPLNKALHCSTHPWRSTSVMA